MKKSALWVICTSLCLCPLGYAKDVLFPERAKILKAFQVLPNDSFVRFFIGSAEKYSSPEAVVLVFERSINHYKEIYPDHDITKCLPLIIQNLFLSDFPEETFYILKRLSEKEFISLSDWWRLNRRENKSIQMSAGEPSIILTSRSAEYVGFPSGWAEGETGSREILNQRLTQVSDHPFLKEFVYPILVEGMDRRNITPVQLVRRFAELKEKLEIHFLISSETPWREEKKAQYREWIHSLIPSWVAAIVHAKTLTYRQTLALMRNLQWFPSRGGFGLWTQNVEPDLPKVVPEALHLRDPEEVSYYREALSIFQSILEEAIEDWNTRRGGFYLSGSLESQIGTVSYSTPQHLFLETSVSKATKGEYAHAMYTPFGAFHLSGEPRGEENLEFLRFLKNKLFSSDDLVFQEVTQQTLLLDYLSGFGASWSPVSLRYQGRVRKLYWIKKVGRISFYPPGQAPFILFHNGEEVRAWAGK